MSRDFDDYLRTLPVEDEELPEAVKQKWIPSFMRRVQKTEDCWLWTGNNLYGSPQCHVDGRTYMANRAAYLLFVGPLYKKTQVKRKCKNSLCVKPDHLYLGVQHLRELARKVRR